MRRVIYKCDGCGGEVEDGTLRWWSVRKDSEGFTFKSSRLSESFLQTYCQPSCMKRAIDAEIEGQTKALSR